MFPPLMHHRNMEVKSKGHPALMGGGGRGGFAATFPIYLKKKGYSVSEPESS